MADERTKLFLGLFSLDRKTYSQNQNDREIWRLHYSDDDGNKISINVDKATFEAAKPGVEIPVSRIAEQAQIEEDLN